MNFEEFVVGASANQDVAVQNLWQFFRAQHLQAIYFSPPNYLQIAYAARPRTIAKDLGVALMECCKFNSKAILNALSICETVYENTKSAAVA